VRCGGATIGFPLARAIGVQPTFSASGVVACIAATVVARGLRGFALPCEANNALWANAMCG
jgi:hypothetical protein